MTSATETPEELQHRLKLESVKTYASIGGIAAIFLILVLILFFHSNAELVKTSAAILNTLAGGLIGYLVKR